MSGRQLLPKPAWLGLLVGLSTVGCERDDKLDTDSPWPAAGEGEGEGEGEATLDEPFVGVLSDTALSEVGDTGAAGDSSLLNVSVGDDLLNVTHEGVSLAPCEDFAVTGTTSEGNLEVIASYENADCGSGEPHSLVWSMPAPQSPGEWSLTIAGDVALFEIE